MRVLSISASNMVHAKKESTSLEVCQIIEKIIKTKLTGNGVQLEIIRLVDADLSPCTGCGKCFMMNKCCTDDSFNNIYSRIAQSDALFIVSPHYAPVPAKLCMLLEKMEQISFLNRFHNINYRPIVYKVPVGIIAHGGGSDNEMGVRANYGSPLSRTLDLNDISAGSNGAPDVGRMHAAVGSL